MQAFRVFFQLTLLSLTSLQCQSLEIYSGEKKELNLNYNLTPAYNRVPGDMKDALCIRVKVKPEDSKLAELVGSDIYGVDDVTNTTNEDALTSVLPVVVKGQFPGKCHLLLELVSCDMNVLEEQVYDRKRFPLTVHMELNLIRKVFLVTVLAFTVVENIGLVCLFDPHGLKKQLTQWRPLVTGIVCQQVFMPLFSFMVVYYIEMGPGMALGIFMLGCSPGGQMVRVYSYILGGEPMLTDLLILLNLVAHTALLPLWLLKLGPLLCNEIEDCHISLETTLYILLIVTAPIAIGIIIVLLKSAKTSRWILKLAPVFVFLKTLVPTTLGVIGYIFFILIIPFDVAITSIAISYIGYGFAFVISFIIRLTKPEAISIAIGTGIQKSWLVVLMMQMSLSSPENFTSLMGPMVVTFLSPLPLVVLTLLRGRKGRDLTVAAIVTPHNEIGAEGHVETTTVHSLNFDDDGDDEFKDDSYEDMKKRTTRLLGKPETYSRKKSPYDTTRSGSPRSGTLTPTASLRELEFNA